MRGEALTLVATEQDPDHRSQRAQRDITEEKNLS